MEMAQMEVAYRISAAKRAVRGEAALNDTDREHIHRYSAIEIGATVALHPLAPPASSCDLLAHDKITALSGVRKRLATVGVEVYALNLTRPDLGIAVTRTIAPGLEIGLRSPPGPRLRSVADRTGIDLTRSILL
jgi:ribosomal protein S12 methylthiotransferase accessory factor YcaO